jgi:DNA-directed RNA polymerase specialized sigma subunit
MDCKRCKIREEQKIMENQHIKDIEDRLAEWIVKRLRFQSETDPEPIRLYRAGYNDAMREVIDLFNYTRDIQHALEVKEEPSKKAEPKQEKIEKSKKEKAEPKQEKPKKKTVKKTKKIDKSSIDVSYLVSRKQRGLTYKQLGEEFGISQSTAYRLYNDYINQFNKKGDTK